MEKNRIIKITPFGAIVCIFQIVFVAVMATLFVEVLKEEAIIPEVSFEDGSIFDKIEGLPEDARQMLERGLYGEIAKNTDIRYSIPNSGASIRNETLISTYFDEIDVHYVYFIVDIPELEQSYQIKYEWSDDVKNQNLSINDRMMVMCPSEEQLVYESFDCVDDYNQNGESLILYAYINENSFEGFDVILPDDFNQFVVISGFNIRVDGEIDSELSVIALKNFIKSLGFDAEKFEYSVSGI